MYNSIQMLTEARIYAFPSAFVWVWSFGGVLFSCLFHVSQNGSLPEVPHCHGTLHCILQGWILCCRPDKWKVSTVTIILLQRLHFWV